MTINSLAIRLLSYFSPEERSIPDAVNYPGRNAAVTESINAALQEMFGEGKPWVRKQPRGGMVYAPVTVDITVAEGSSIASISSTDWQDWFAGCAIVITGASVDNRILSANTFDSVTATVTINPDGADNSLTFTAQEAGERGNDISITYNTPASAAIEVSVVGSAITVDAGAKARMVISGVTDPVGINGTLINTGIQQNGKDSWSSDGTLGSGVTILRYTGTNWQLKVSVGLMISYLSEVASVANFPDGLTFDAPAFGTGTPTVTAKAPSATQVKAAIEAQVEAADLVAVTAVGAITGEVAAVNETFLVGASGGIPLAMPYDGTSGTVLATIYCDSVAVPQDVLRVNDPVKFGQRPVLAMSGADGGDERHYWDFGIHLTDDSIVLNRRISETAGTPAWYFTESWVGNENDAPGIRIRLAPAPNVKGVLSYQTMLLPFVVDDLTSVANLPVPSNFTESILTPIAVKALMGTQWFRGMETPEAVNAAYKEAMRLLATLNPNRTRRVTIVTKG